MAADDVSLPDLEVIAQFSLAVRAATAPRAQVVAALEADLAALTGQRRTARARPVSVPGRAAQEAAETAPEDEPAPRAPRRTTRAAAAAKAPAAARTPARRRTGRTEA